MPDELIGQWARRPGVLHGVRLDRARATRSWRPTTCSARWRPPRPRRGGTSLLFTGDRDMFQCVSESCAVLFPGAKGGPTLIDEAGVRERYGVAPDAGAGLHRTARRPVRRAARRQGHRREDRRRAAARPWRSRDPDRERPAPSARPSRAHCATRPTSCAPSGDRDASAHAGRAPAGSAARRRRSRGGGRERGMNRLAERLDACDIAGNALE